MQLLEIIDYGPNTFGTYEESSGNPENIRENLAALLLPRRRRGSRRAGRRVRRARWGAPDAARRLALRWHSVFFTCPLLDSS
jgi:hypothetical protein